MQFIRNDVGSLESREPLELGDFERSAGIFSGLLDDPFFAGGHRVRDLQGYGQKPPAKRGDRHG